MVTGVLNDSTNQPLKQPKQKRPHKERKKDRPSTSEILFAPQPQTFPSANLLPMPKALTASLPVFDGKSEKFELQRPLQNTTKHSFVDFGKSDTTPQKRALRTPTNPKHQNPSETRAAKCT